MSTWAPSGGFKNTPVPQQVAPPVAPRPVTVPVSVKGAGSVQVSPRIDFKTFYDPSRVIDLDKLKVVADLRTEGSERGETQDGDAGTLGPGSNSGAFVNVGKPNGKSISAPVAKEGLTPGQLALIALGSFLLLGG